ncbi:hypothetical protein M0802_001925 [Mischocyttarus mexicanus]|nr:hypothetical protein M0802_001925 [Mischocyttarus mexicanus]
MSRACRLEYYQRALIVFGPFKLAWQVAQSLVARSSLMLEHSRSKEKKSESKTNCTLSAASRPSSKIEPDYSYSLL